MQATATASSRDNCEVRKKSARGRQPRPNSMCFFASDRPAHTSVVGRCAVGMCRARARHSVETTPHCGFHPPPLQQDAPFHEYADTLDGRPLFSDPHGGRSVIDHTSRGVLHGRLDHDDHTEDVPRSTHIQPTLSPPFFTTDYHFFSDLRGCSVVGVIRMEKPTQLESIHTASSTPPQPRPY